MARSTLTPGRLYALLSAEFRQARSKACTAHCGMPLPVCRLTDDPEGPNWCVAQSPLGCAACEGVIRGIVERASTRFDLFDPTSPPFMRAPGAQVRTARPEGA